MALAERRTGSIVAPLRDVALFRWLREADLAGLAQQVMVERYRRRALIFSQGQLGDGLYIVVQGYSGASRGG